MKNEKGFSLLELMVVIAIISILCIMVIPNFYGWITTAKIRGVTNNLSSDIQHTRMIAIKENRRVVLLLNNKGYIIFVDKNKDGIKNNDDRLIKNITIFEGISISNTFKNNSIKFNGRGILTKIDEEGSIKLTNNVDIRILDVNFLGFIKLTK